MNGKTAKLISKYALETGEPEKRLKANWNRLNHKERASERRRMQGALERE